MSILVITTGGTIGGLAYDNLEKPPDFVPMPLVGTDIICEALTKEFSWAECRCKSLEPRDSKNIDEPYRQNMMKVIADAAEKKVLVTSGTDRVLQIAEHFFYACAADPELRKKTIFLTGSMIPLANGPQSDGYQNLEYALRQLADKDIPAGVFIVLCDFDSPNDESGNWAPRLYPYSPGAYEKVYTPDARYNRLRRA